MRFAGEIAVAAPREAVFARISDPRFLVSCIEGVGDLHEIDATHYTATIQTRVAYIRLKFQVSVEILRIEAPHRIETRMEGRPLGIIGRLVASSVTRLEESGGETRLIYETEMSLAGKLGSIGQSAFAAKAKDMEAQFAQNLRAAFADAGAPTGAAAS
jgi:uncharacterized protein